MNRLNFFLPFVGALAWLSWLWRYDVQVIPVTVAELYAADSKGWAVDKNGTAYAFSAETGLARPVTNSAGESFVPLMAESPAIVWKWDRWTATGVVQAFASVDAAGRVSLTPVK